MRKPTLVITALAVLLAASFVSPLSALGAAAPNRPVLPGDHSGARSAPRLAVSGRASATRTVVTSPVSCDAAFHFVFSPDSTGDNFLVSTAAISANDIWAVGNSTSSGGFDQTLAEHWNGTSWSIVTTPNVGSFSNDLNSVTAISTNDVWAVGTYQVDNTGFDFGTIAEHWNGTAWSVTWNIGPNPLFELFEGVTAVSSTDVWAVGLYFNSGFNGFLSLVEHWNGTTWTQIPSVDPSTSDTELFAVSAFSSTDVWAVGESSTGSPPTNSLAEHWNGAAWSTIATPNLGGGGSGNAIEGVRVLEAGHAVGVGFGNFVTMTTPRIGAAWDLLTGAPSTGSLESGPGSGDNALLDVATSGAGVWAVGYWRNTVNSARQALVIPATWNSTAHTLTWSPVGTSDSPSAINNVFYSVAAVSPYSFWTVGYDTSGANVNQTLAESYCARHFNLSGPPASNDGSAFSLLVKVQNGDGATATGYRGTVHFTSSDLSSTLPGDYTFTSGDLGSHTFAGVVLNTQGSQTITVTDLVMPLTVPAAATVQVCLGACPAPSGTAGSRAVGAGATGTAGSRAANPSGTGSAGPRLPRLIQAGLNSDPALGVAPLSTTSLIQTVRSGGLPATTASTQHQSARSTGQAAEAGSSSTGVQAQAVDAQSIASRSGPVPRPPDGALWTDMMLLSALVACSLMLVSRRRRKLKEMSNGPTGP